MKKLFVAKNVKKVFAIALATALAAPTIIGVNSTKVAAATTTVPDPIVSYDFSKEISEIEGAEIVNSEPVYFVKAEEDLAEGEKLDANGIVYTGEGAEAKYVTLAPVGAPTIIDVTDSGAKVSKALQFDDTTKEIDQYQKKVSAKTDDMSEETAKYLDFQMPKNDYYYVESGTVSSKPLTCQSVSAELKLNNPFAGLADELKEYDELDDVNAKKVGSKYVPLWTKGLTISYWIKVPVDEKGVYQNSSVLRWENDNEYLLQCDDYSKYLPVKLWDMHYDVLSEEKKAQGFEYSPSGVIPYAKGEDGTYPDPDGLMDFYFDYADGFYEKTEEGFVPEIITNSTGESGPVYDWALIEEMKAALKGKTAFTGSARYYFANPNYRDGFYYLSDGTTLKSIKTDVGTTATYNIYRDLPEIKNASTGDVTYPTTSYYRLKSADETISPGNSNIRYALVDGELQIDADSSIFWVSDDNQGINENSNVIASYNTKAGMQNGDVFFMNSWQEADTSKTDGKYSTALFVADSPVSINNEKNKNAGKWHQVTITLENDWVEFYIDGEITKLDLGIPDEDPLEGVEFCYSSRGGKSLDTKKSFKRLNKGAGLRNGAGSEKDMGNISYGNYVCRLLMDWISDENSKLCLGGIGNYALKYAQATTTSKVCLGDIKFYKTVLKPDQIKALYEGGGTVIKGDVTGDSQVTLDDVTAILKIALKLSTPTDTAILDAADVNGKDGVTLDDVTEALKIALKIV